MDILILLIPIALGLGVVGLAAFMWALRSGQFDDPEGAANRVLFDEEHPDQAQEQVEQGNAHKL
ncbi:MAG: cbb3-type cytochrome oxidase assembly protein CcoS [Bdellovibrionales bacterium]